MSQCVPNWDLDDPPNPLNPPAAAAAAAAHGSRSEYEVAELTWVNGHPSKHGLGGALRIGKPVPKYPSPASWDKSLAGGGGTLESVVDQATGAVLLPPSGSQSPAGTEYDLVPWIAARQRRGCSTGTTTTAGTNTVVDALVPCSNRSNLVDDATGVPDPSGRNKLARVVGGGGGEGVDGNCSVSGSAASMGLGGFDTCDINGDGGGGDDVGFTTSTSPLDGSPDTENTSCGRPVTIVDEHDSASHSLLSQRDEGEKKRKGDVRGSSVSTKRSRAAAVHNQSERKRRDRINQRMKTLQKLVPNSSKTDKASMLDEVIDYLKQLQAQVQMMNRMNTIPQMMMPMPMQQLQMAMMAQMAQMAQMGMGMGMAMGMDMNPLARPHPPAPVGMHSPPVLHPSAFLPFAGGTSWDAVGDRMATVPCSTSLPPATAAIAPTDPFSAFMACQSPKPMNMDAFNRMAAAMYQQLFQQQSSQMNHNSNK